MKARSEVMTEAVPAVESLQLELDGCRSRLGELERAEALLAGENRLLEMVALGEALPSILNDICRLVEDISPGSLCSILLLDPNDNRLRHGAAPSLPASYIGTFGGKAIGPGTGPCGRAAFFRKPAIVGDIAADPLGDDYRDLALAHGLRACWSTPILASGGKVLGTFAILSRQPCTPNSRDQRIIAQITHLAAVAIERQRTEEELRRSEAYLAEAQKLSLTGSFGWKVSSRELTWSAETFRILGYDRSATPTLELVLQRVHPDDAGRLQTTVNDAMRDETDFDFEHRLRMPDGSVKHLRVKARPTRSETGEVEFVGAVMDVTERNRSYQATRAAKARFEGILEIAEDAIVSVDYNQCIVLFNQGAEKVFGYTQGEVIGKPLDLLLPKRFAHAHRGHLKEFAGSQDVARAMGQRREVFGLRKDGHEFPAEASISKLGLGREQVFTVILRDITERKRAAEALRASEQLARGQTEALTRALDALARESSPDRIVEHILRTMISQLEAHSSGVWLLDAATGLMDFEFAFEEGGFKTKADAVLSTISPRLPVAAVWPWPEVFRTGKPSVMEDIREGPDFPWRAHVLAMGVVTILIVPMLMAGKVAGVIGIRFIRKRAFQAGELELAQALANQAMLAIQLTRLGAQSREAAVMAERNRMARDIHDTLAQGFTGVIVQLEAAADAMSRGLAKEAEEHRGRAGELARESLREARRSVRALRPQALEDKDLCEALEALIHKMAAGTPVRTEFVVQGKGRKLPPEWDENLLRIGQEVLTNVLRHARASHFKVRLEFTPGQVHLELRDNGCGFDPAGKYDGFGLLGIRERVEGMGGQLAIRSARGEGAVISIALPLAESLEGLAS